MYVVIMSNIYCNCHIF